MLSANLSWKNPKEAETVGQHREHKSRQRGGSRSSGSSTASAPHAQRPQTRDTTHSRSVWRKTPTPASSTADTSPPKASMLPHPGSDALGFLFPPRQDADSLYELDSTAGSTGRHPAPAQLPRIQPADVEPQTSRVTATPSR